jgi:hypothetical protein
MSKNPKLDSSALFDKMRGRKGKLKEIKSVLDEITKTGDDTIKIAGTIKIADSAIGKCLGQLIMVVRLLLSQQESLASAVIDTCHVTNQNPTKSINSHKSCYCPAIRKIFTSGEIQDKRLGQAIKKAEKSSNLFVFNLGPGAHGVHIWRG